MGERFNTGKGLKDIGPQADWRGNGRVSSSNSLKPGLLAHEMCFAVDVL
jgi:hypothetical protein